MSTVKLEKALRVERARNDELVKLLTEARAQLANSNVGKLSADLTALAAGVLALAKHTEMHRDQINFITGRVEKLEDSGKAKPAPADAPAPEAAPEKA